MIVFVGPDVRFWHEAAPEGISMGCYERKADIHCG